MSPAMHGHRHPCHGHRRSPACHALLTLLLHFPGTREIARLKPVQVRGNAKIRMTSSPIIIDAEVIDTEVERLEVERSEIERPEIQQSDTEVKRLDARTLKPGELIKNVKTPVALTNLAENWPGALDWNTEYLAEQHGNLMVPFLTLPDEIFDEDPHGPEVGNSLYADHFRNSYVPHIRTPLYARLSDVVNFGYEDYLFTFDDSTAKRLAADALGGSSRVPRIFSADNLTQFTFGVGPAGDGVMFHAHTAAWNALLYGEKEWLFIAPNNFTGDVYEHLSMVSSTGLAKAVETMNFSYTMLRCRQKAGEVVWIPDGWWHATYGHTATGCVGGQRHKEKLPPDYWSSNLEAWPGAGIYVNGVARDLKNASLFEAAIEREPYNFHFVMECLFHLREEKQYLRSDKVAKQYRDNMEKCWRKGSLGRAEFAAQLAELAGFFYDCVEQAMKEEEMGAIVIMSRTTNTFVEEALYLDEGCPVAVALKKRIERQSKVGVKQIEEDPSTLMKLTEAKNELEVSGQLA